MAAMEKTREALETLALKAAGDGYAAALENLETAVAHVEWILEQTDAD